MEPLQAPEGEVVATHPATVYGSILAVLMMVLPGGALVAFALRFDGKDADARVPAIAGGLTLLVLGILAVVQQARSKVVLRADGAERWGLRGAPSCCGPAARLPGFPGQGGSVRRRSLVP